MTGIGAAMLGGNPQLGREENDHYRSPAAVTQNLLEVWKPRSKTVWEPACGNGAMAEVIKEHGYDVIASDLHDYGYGQTGEDFLQTTERAADCLITNPPFEDDLPEKFIRHAFSLGVIEIALVLGSNYWHAACREKLYHEHMPSIVWPMLWRPDFKGLGRPTMNLIWCLWSQELGPQGLYRPMPRPAAMAAAKRKPRKAKKV